MSAVSEERSDLSRLAYELSSRMLERQDGLVDDLRARTGTLLAAASLISSFLGAPALERSGLTVINLVALGAFVFSAAACVYILLPKEELIFALRGSVLFEEEFARAAPLAETHRRLAYWIEGYWEENRVRINRLSVWYRWAARALIVEIGLWALSLGDTL